MIQDQSKLYLKLYLDPFGVSLVKRKLVSLSSERSRLSRQVKRLGV